MDATSCRLPTLKAVSIKLAVTSLFRGDLNPKLGVPVEDTLSRKGQQTSTSAAAIVGGLWKGTHASTPLLVLLLQRAAFLLAEAHPPPCH